MHPLANFLAFQAGWFASVLGAAGGKPWLGPIVVAIVVCTHLLAVTRPRREWRLLVIALAIGCVVDSLFTAGGWLQYSSGQWVSWLAPYWIVMMWPLFATTLNVSLRWLHGRTGLAAVLGAVAGPLSYFGGAKLGAVAAAPGPWPWVVIGVAWGVVLPILCHLSKRMDGTETGPLPSHVSGWMGSS